MEDICRGTCGPVESIVPRTLGLSAVRDRVGNYENGEILSINNVEMQLPEA